jgi:hypothetical protein
MPFLWFQMFATFPQLFFFGINPYDKGTPKPAAKPSVNYDEMADAYARDEKRG